MKEGARHPNANTVWIDGDKLKRLLWLRRIPLSSVGPLIGRCSGWASVICKQGHAGYYALDDLSQELGFPHVDLLIAEIAAQKELERLQVG